MQLSVLIFGGSQAVRQRLVQAVARCPTVSWWDCVARADELVASYRRHPVDVVLVATQWAMSTGVEAASQLTRALPGTRVLLVGPGDDQALVAAAVATGAHGFLRWEALGSPVMLAMLADAVGRVELRRSVGQLGAARRRHHALLASPAVAPGAVLDGGLSKRELQVLLGMTQGKTNRAIGRDLGLSEQTVKIYIRRLFHKLGVTTRPAAVLAGFRSGLLS